MDECYVCLEETNEKSPCDCAAPIHKTCFMEMQAHHPCSKCSICKKSFHVKLNCKHVAFCVCISFYVACIILFLYYVLVKGTVS